ncbi:odorant receptor 4-like [Xylocopa sonorina]|uniref:odorant receptor 4-like n=1 Tax=Xylocopa sonorina TaxID=1818115 RepID=UPI00403A7F88
MQVEKHQDISVNLCRFFLKNIGLWTAEDLAEERKRKVMIAYTIWCTTLALVVTLRDLYFTWIYNGDILYVLTNCLSAATACGKVYILLLHKVEFIDLIVYMREKFWNSSYDLEEREILDNSRKTCIFFVSSVTTIGMCVMLSYIATPFVTSRASNESERMLIFNMWLNIPISVPPNYELLLLLQVVTLYHIGICYFCVDNIFCMLAIHLTAQFRILQHRFTKLCDMDYEMSEKDQKLTLRNHTDRCYRKLNGYVRQHQALIEFSKKLENVYTMISFLQVLIFSVLICLFGYQILLADAPAARRTIFILLLIGAMFLLFMFTYSCGDVIEQSNGVAVGAYSTLWAITSMNNSGKMLRKDLIMVIARSRQVCCLTANGFFPVSLETYTSILSTAVSYFTLIKSHIEDVT